MGLREAVKDKPMAVRVIATVAVVGMLIYVVRNAMSGSSMPTSKAYFTDDDGQTLFVDTMDHFAPFDHNGKPAYRVWMFSTDGGKTKFIGYLERYTPEAKTRLLAELDDFKSGKSHMPPDVRPNDSEVKKPGAGNPWVSRSDVQKAQQVMKQNVPSDADLEIQLPS